MLNLVAKCSAMNSFGWNDELQVALDLNSLITNFVVSDMEFCKQIGD
jgi:hypothetical protein